MLVLGSHADTLKEAGALNNAKVGTTAISVLYETSEYKGLKFGIGFQSGYDWGIHDESTGLTPQGGEDDPRVSLSTTEIDKAYIDYTFTPELTATNVRIGRQQIITPLIMNSPAFPLRDSFDALVLTNTDLANTKLKLIYIDSWIMRYGDEALPSIYQQNKYFDDDVYSIYLRNNYISGLDIEAQWFNFDNATTAADLPSSITNEPYETSFIGLNYKIPDTSWLIGWKHLYASYDNSQDTDYWGVKVETNFNNIDARLAYTSVADERTFPGTLGHVPQFKAYRLTFVDEIYAGMESTSLMLSSSFEIPGFKARAVYVDWKQSEEGIAASGRNFDGGSELSFDFKYNFQSQKGLSTRFRLTQLDYDQAGDDDLTYMRLYLNYKF
ncbi:MAG: OprD family outer membrane porin [Neptuniibacter sp.]